MKVLTFLIVLFALTKTGFGQEATISVYNTYLQAPIVYPDESGLAKSLVDYLNESVQGKFHFILKNIPRQRLLKYHLGKEEKISEIVIFLSPMFVGDERRRRFIWSPLLFADYNVLIFDQKKSPHIKTLSDLKGMRFSTVRGYRYATLDEMILNGTLIRQEANNEETSLRQIVIGRADFTQMNRLFFLSLSERKEFQENKFLSFKVPEEPTFTRHILYGKAINPEVIKKVNHAIELLPCDNKWKDIARRYDLHLSSCPNRS